MLEVPFPDFRRQQEVVGTDFTSEGVGRNAENSITVIEVVMVFLIFMITRSPRRMILANMDGMFGVFPGFIKTLNSFSIILKTH